MKTLIGILVWGLQGLLALQGCGQGTVIFNNRIAGTLVTHVYLTPWGTQLWGNGSEDTPAGTQNWAGFTKASGSAWSAQLLAAPGSGRSESSLVPAYPITTFRTGAAAGNVAGTTATLNNVAPDAPVATVMMVVWNNMGGRYPDWTSANVAWKGGLTFAGTSGPFDVTAIGGIQNGAAVMQNLRSFSVSIPEPSAIVTGLVGACVWFARRARRCAPGSTVSPRTT